MVLRKFGREACPDVAKGYREAQLGNKEYSLNSFSCKIYNYLSKINYIRIRKNFILTKFIRVIDKPINLTKNLLLDNPRSEDEIRYWSEYVKHSLTNDHLNSNPLFTLPFEYEEGVFNWPETIDTFREQLKSNGYSNIEKFRVEKKDDIFLILAQLLVIIRYPDHGFNDYTDQELSEIMKLFKTDSESQRVKDYIAKMDLDQLEYRKVIESSFLIRFLNEDIFGHESFLINNDNYRDPISFKIDTSLNANLCWWARFICNPKKLSLEHHELSNNTSFESKIKKAFGIFETIEKDTLVEFAAESLYISEKSHSRPGLLAIVSLIEALIIRKPDPNRYHIDDSIMKQFVLKLGIFILDADKNSDIELEKLRLKELYAQRSNIAHGNFREFSKLIAKTKLKIDTQFMSSNPKDWSEEDYIDELMKYAQKVLAIVLNAYISDPVKVNFIKNN